MIFFKGEKTFTKTGAGPKDRTCDSWNKHKQQIDNFGELYLTGVNTQLEHGKFALSRLGRVKTDSRQWMAGAELVAITTV